MSNEILSKRELFAIQILVALQLHASPGRLGNTREAVQMADRLIAELDAAPAKVQP